MAGICETGGTAVRRGCRSTGVSAPVGAGWRQGSHRRSTCATRKAGRGCRSTGVLPDGGRGRRSIGERKVSQGAKSTAATHGWRQGSQINR